jgi:hypothetical protein
MVTISLAGIIKVFSIVSSPLSGAIRFADLGTGRLFPYSYSCAKRKAPTFPPSE